MTVDQLFGVGHEVKVIVFIHQVFGHVFLRDKVSRGPVGVNQVPVVVNIHCIPAVVVFGALELVTGAVVQTLGKSCQHRTEQASISTECLVYPGVGPFLVFEGFQDLLWRSLGSVGKAYCVHVLACHPSKDCSGFIKVGLVILTVNQVPYQISKGFVVLASHRNGVFIDKAELSDVTVDVKLPVAGAGGWGDIGLLGQKVHRLEVVGGFHGVNRLPMAFY